MEINGYVTNVTDVTDVTNVADVTEQNGGALCGEEQEGRKDA